MSDDEDLYEHMVKRIGDGDADAEAWLFEHFSRGLVIYLWRVSGNHELARDLVQDTMITALQRLRRGDIDDARSLKPFLKGIARNKLSNHYRLAFVRLVELDPEAQESHARAGDCDIPSIVDMDRLVDAVEKVLDEMQPRDVEVLIHHRLSNESIADTAERCGTTREHVSRIAYRARERVLRHPSSGVLAVAFPADRLGEGEVQVTAYSEAADADGGPQARLELTLE